VSAATLADISSGRFGGFPSKKIFKKLAGRLGRKLAFAVRLIWLAFNIAHMFVFLQEDF
jgi:hypothetical protein